MSLFAHAVIEVANARYQRGDEVPDDLEGIDELIAGGSVSEEPYDPASDVVPPPATLEIEGVRYIQVHDDAEGTDVRTS